MDISGFRLAALLVLALLVGYVIAYIPALQVPALQVPALQSLRRWHPPAAVVSPVQIQVQGVGWVGTRTPYFEQTITFFRDILHLRLTMQTPQFAEFKLEGGERLGIFAQRSPEAAFMRGPMMEFEVADVDQARSQLEAAGVKFVGDTHRDPKSGLTWTEFWGPDGYPYGLTSAALK